MPSDSPYLLEMRGITKRFPGVVALKDVQLCLRGGEVLALMGENGAGKSTLMKILGGAYAPDEGELLVDGRPVTLRGIKDAKRLGIALIHQELMLAPNLDIAGNIFLGNERRNALGGLDRKAMHVAAQKLIQRVGLNARPTTPLSSLTTGQMQMVEIAKALSVNARVIIMDEPTSSLATAESRKLFEIIRTLRAEGIGIIYISHRMEEVFQLSDRITILRDGRYVGDLTAAEASHDKVVAMMVGREVSRRYPDRTNAAGEPILQVNNVLVPGASRGVSFTARRGEIVGFAGLVGAGRTELMQVIFGAVRSLGGEMTFEGRPYHPKSTRDAIRAGIYLAPEDRKRHGLVLPMTIAQNTSLPNIANYRPKFWLQRAAERRVAAAEVARFKVKTPTIHRKVVNLSGGNQQKVVLGKWLAMEPKILILDEPTRGIDVGAKAEIYRHIVTLADQGITILVVSSELEEVLGLSDRIIVMHERRMTGELTRATATPEAVAALMTGKATPATTHA